MKQIVVLTEDHPGVLADLSACLAGRSINIEELSGDALQTSGVVRLTVDRYDEALVALRDAGFQAVSEDALVLRLPDEPGALARAMARFKQENINVRSMRILRRDGGQTLVALVVADGEAERAARVALADVVLAGAD
jgi:hypothetical protein